jgi:hypothetical protein
MATRSIQLVRYREASSQRAHFAIFVPDVGIPGQGTLIHVVGSPMTGYSLEFKRQYNLEATNRRHDTVTIAQVPAQHVAILPDANLSRPDLPRTNLEQVACEIQPPGPSQNFMAPIDGVSEQIFQLRKRRVDLHFVRSSTDDAKSGLWTTSACLFSAGWLPQLLLTLSSSDVILPPMALA